MWIDFPRARRWRLPRWTFEGPLAGARNLLDHRETKLEYFERRLEDGAAAADQSATP